MPLVELLEVLGLVGRAEHVGVGGVGLLGRHLVGEAGLGHERRHLGAAAELVDEGLVEPGLVDAQGRVGEQAVAVEALDVVALEGAAVAPDVDAVLLHRRDQHRAGDGAAERRGVEVGDAGGRDVEGAALQRRQALGRELARGSRSGAPSRRRTASPGAGCRRSRARRAGRGWRCRRRGWRPCRASSAAPRWCRGRRRRRCRRARRREGAGGSWLMCGLSQRLRMRFAAKGRYFPRRRHPRTREVARDRPCGKLRGPSGSARSSTSMSTHPPTLGQAAGPAAAMTEHDALPPGTRFGEFEILRVLGVGGFGIVYLAHDHSLEREVALKEYMPASLAARGAGPQITVRSSSFAETYAIGLRSFINEARLLARFDHPSLVKVYRFWEDNATAYMVMPFLQGTTLRDTRRAHGASARRGLDPQRPRRRSWRRSSCCTAKASTTATSRPTTSCCRPTARRCCSTSARRGASSATAPSRSPRSSSRATRRSSSTPR